MLEFLILKKSYPILIHSSFTPKIYIIFIFFRFVTMNKILIRILWKLALLRLSSSSTSTTTATSTATTGTSTAQTGRTTQPGYVDKRNGVEGVTLPK